MASLERAEGGEAVISAEITDYTCKVRLTELYDANTVLRDIL